MSNQANADIGVSVEGLQPVLSPANRQPPIRADRSLALGLTWMFLKPLLAGGAMHFLVSDPRMRARFCVHLSEDLGASDSS